MSGRETATVETLTASVKTLMVGARQGHDGGINPVC